MRISVAGAGPAGLYFAALAKRADPSHQISVIERNPPDATYGWGVVFSEETLGEFREADPKTYDRITDGFARWDAIDVRFRGETVRSRGHTFSAIARKRLLEILQERCRELGVSLEFQRELDEAAYERLSAEHDLFVAADGVNSLARRTFAKELGASVDTQSTRFIWFGTDLVFRAFTFIFRDTEHGLFQVHAYPFDASTSTFIVECREDVWHRAGLDRASEEDSIAFCEALFAEELRGHRLLSNRSLWLRFPTVTCQSWHRGNVALLGDACHTAHFTIGSGTKLAMEDAISLAGSLERLGPTDLGSLEAALVQYELERQPVVERFQEAARESQSYFEDVSRYASFEPRQFAFNLLTRSGRIGHANLSQRDPGFVRRLDTWFHPLEHEHDPVRSPAQTPHDSNLSQTTARHVAPPPAFAPMRLRQLSMANRLVVGPPAPDGANDGMPGEPHIETLARGAASGAGLVLTEMLAVAPEGRITPGSGGLYLLEHGRVWARALAQARERAGPGAAAIGAQIGHAGRRGSTRPRAEGTDLPLRVGNWPLVSASAEPFAPWSRYPREMLREDMERTREAFARGARTAAEAGFDLLEVNAAQGYLLASFLSPLSNHRLDALGGPLEQRMRFPLEVVEAVREAWPAERPLSVRLVAADLARGGLEVEDAVAVARELLARGVDLVHVSAGGTVPETRPSYRRFHLVAETDRVRNEAGVVALSGGRLSTLDEAHTVVAAGRADLCLIAAPND